MLKFSKPGFNSMWNENLQMFKLVLEKAEETEIKLQTSIGSWKKQESSRKTSTYALSTMPKPLTVWITRNCGKFWKRWEYQTTMASRTRWMRVWMNPGDGDGQGGLACCGSWGCKESDMTKQLNWTEPLFQLLSYAYKIGFRMWISELSRQGLMMCRWCHGIPDPEEARRGSGSRLWSASGHFQGSLGIRVSVQNWGTF